MIDRLGAGILGDGVQRARRLEAGHAHIFIINARPGCEIQDRFALNRMEVIKDQRFCGISQDVRAENRKLPGCRLRCDVGILSENSQRRPGLRDARFCFLTVGAGVFAGLGTRYDEWQDSGAI